MEEKEAEPEANKPKIYNKKECIAMSKEYFKSNKGVEVLYFAEDGVPFFDINDARAYCKGQIFKVEK